MSQGIELTGMVLSASPSGDYDKRVVLLTKERGRIVAFARRARRQDSPLLAAVSPFCFGTFTLYEGRTAYTLVSADISNYFQEVRADLEKVCYGSYFMEFADYYSVENMDESRTLNLLYASLRALTREELPDRLVRYIFELKLMVFNGEYPQDVIYDPAVNETVRYAVKYVVEAPVKKLYSFTLSEPVLEEFAALQDRIRKRTVDRKFRSLEILEMMTG